MKLSFGPRDRLIVDDARIMFPNFEGREEKYNRKGDRNFLLVIPTEEMAQALMERGWNVSIRDKRDEGGDLFMSLKVKVKFNDRGPTIYMNTNGKVNILDEESAGMIDNIDIATVAMDIRPYDWEVSGKCGRTAYLERMDVVQEMDRFAARYHEEEAMPF